MIHTLDPALALDPSGWRAATRGMTLEERGAYFDLICLSAQTPSDSDASLAHRMHVSKRKLRSLKERIGSQDLSPPFTRAIEETDRGVRASDFYQRQSIPQATRRAVYERDGYRCLKCGTNRRLSLDHIIAVTSGGDNSVGNLQTLCLPCNLKKGAKNGECA